MIRKTSVFDVMRRLLQPKNLMVSIAPTKRSAFLSVWGLLRGDVDSLDVNVDVLRCHCLVAQKYDACSRETAG